MSDLYPFTLLPSPENLIGPDNSNQKDITFIGKTLYITGIYQTNDIFGIKRVDRNRHTYILGKSGMGKSYLMEQMIRSDIENGFGLALIDPHKDLAFKLLSSIPPNRLKDVVYIDPSKQAKFIAFNPFANVPQEHRQSMAQGLVEIFRKQFASTWSPRIEHLFRFATLAMLEYEEGTLYGIMELITNAHYRQKVLQNIEDDVIKRFFSVEFASFSQKYDQEAITPLTNRLGHFFSDPLMLTIFTKKENAIDISEIMNNGKILIINTAKGVLGEENSALFGSFFLTKIEQAAMARSQIDVKDRLPFYLYVDEFQNVATESFVALFSESRKYSINITVANQYLTQLPENLINAVLGNVGIMIVFRVGGQDAERMSLEFQPQLKSHDFLNLGVGEFYIKMAIDGKTTLPFSATTLKLSEPEYPQNVDYILKNNSLYIDKDSGSQTFDLENDMNDLPPPL
ncbi:MAG: DUF87 domain-containing protein [Candidatus Magasanikbacteria bacterium]